LHLYLKKIAEKADIGRQRAHSPTLLHLKLKLVQQLGLRLVTCAYYTLALPEGFTFYIHRNTTIFTELIKTENFQFSLKPLQKIPEVEIHIIKFQLSPTN